MNKMDKEALDKIEDLREDRDYWIAMYHIERELREETEEALKAAKGQLQILRVDRRYEVA